MLSVKQIKQKDKRREWLNRYIQAELLGTVIAVIVASITYYHTHSYIASAAAGWLGEGIGFYGSFVTAELIRNGKKYARYSPIKRLLLIIASASTNLVVEFLPAEILDNLTIRPFAMYIAPQYIHPYPVGFLVGKFGSDLIFYAIAIIGYETRKRWIRH